MKKNTAFRESFDPRSGLALIAVLAAGAMLFAIVAGTAAARPLAKDGKIHACYRVKGKPKGGLRVVAGARVHCRRGERKVAWSVASTSGPQGGGSQGAQGQPGASDSAATDDAALKAQVGDLALRVEALEGVLQDITNGDLTGMLATLQGLNNEDLRGAVNAVPLVKALCDQAPVLTEQVNLLQNVIGGLNLSGVLGGLLEIPTLPDELEPFSCPAP